MMHMSNKKHQGFSFIEVLVAIIISSIGLLGLAAMQLRSMKIESSSLGRSQAILIVNDLANNIYLSEENPLNFVTNESGIQCSSFEQPAEMCSDTDPDSTAEECSLSAAAKYAIWDNLCKGQKEDDIISSGSSDLIDPILLISCNDGFDTTLCTDSPSIEISLSWKNIIRTADSDSKQPKTYKNSERIAYTLGIHP